jgi:5-keto-L-gluconate epimerase
VNRTARDVGVSLSPEKSPFGPLLFAGDLVRGMECAKELGYAGVELSLLDSAMVDRDGIQKALERLKLKVFTIATGQTYYNDGYSLYGESETSSQKAVERISGHIDFARELGCKVILGGVRGKLAGSQENQRATQDRGERAIAECARYAEGKGVELLLEPINRYETNVVNTLAEGADLIKRLRSKSLKLLPDTYHMNLEESDIPESIVEAGRWVGYIHLADSNRWAPGYGHIPFEPILRSLDAIGYEGPIGVEVLPKPDSWTAAAQAIAAIRGFWEGDKS